jgi:hypothetical protein
MDNWMLIPRTEGEKTIYLSQEQAEFISKQWRNNVIAEIHDSSGKLIEVLHRKDWQLKNKQEEKEDRIFGEKGWICGHGKWQPMSQGMCTDDFGKRGWRADCNCNYE